MATSKLNEKAESAAADIARAYYQDGTQNFSLDFFRTQFQESDGAKLGILIYETSWSLERDFGITMRQANAAYIIIDDAKRQEARADRRVRKAHKQLLRRQEALRGIAHRLGTDSEAGRALLAKSDKAGQQQVALRAASARQKRGVVE